MKVNKKGEAKCEHGEIRVGNFFVKDEGVGDWNAHIKITDLSGSISHRVWKRMPIGIWLTNLLERKDEEALGSLKTYIGFMWSAFAVVPDNEYVQSVMDATKANFERHPDWYGAKRKEDEKADADALQSVRDMKEFEEDIKEVVEKEGE